MSKLGKTFDRPARFYSPVRKAAPISVPVAIGRLQDNGWTFKGYFKGVYSFKSGLDKLDLRINDLRKAADNPPTPGSQDVKHRADIPRPTIVAPTTPIAMRRR